nr:hypothetical protein Iba_chr03dCG1770 [Ipomoea batatas]
MTDLDFVKCLKSIKLIKDLKHCALHFTLTIHKQENAGDGGPRVRCCAGDVQTRKKALTVEHKQRPAARWRTGDRGGRARGQRRRTEMLEMGSGNIGDVGCGVTTCGGVGCGVTTCDGEQRWGVETAVAGILATDAEMEF